MKHCAWILVGAGMVIGVLTAGPGCSTPTPVAAPTPEPVQLLADPIVKITAAGLQPQVLHIASVSITFINNDSRPHDIRSDPHPAHSECALMNLGVIPAGATMQTASLTVGQGCSFHDDMNLGNQAFQGFALGH